MKLKLNQLIEVEWDDVVTHSKWFTKGEAEKELLCKCKSVGYFLNQDKKTIRFSCSIQYNELKPERDLTIIPVGCITKIRRLK